MENPEDQAWQQSQGLGSQLLSERDELLVQGAAVEKAAVLVDMALDGVGIPFETLKEDGSEAAMRAYLIYHKLEWLRDAAVLALLVLLFLEAPPWMRQMCPDPQQYPLGSLPYIYAPTVVSVQAACTVLLALETWLVLQYRGWGDLCKAPVHGTKILLLLCLAADCLSLENDVFVRVGYYIRIPVVVTFQRELRETFCALVQIVRKFLDVVLLVFLYIAIFAWLGMLFFHESEEGRQWFPTYQHSLLNMFYLLTLSYNPNIQIPAYEANRWSVWFFIVFLVLGIFILMNLMLAVIYEAFKEQVVKQLVKEEKNRDRDLRAAFHFLDDQGRGWINSSQMVELFTALSRFRSVPSLQTMQLYLSELNSEESFKVTEDEFLDLCHVIVSRFVKVEEPHFLESCWPGLFFSGSFQTFAAMVAHPGFTMAVDVILLLNLVVLVMEGMTDMSDSPSHEYWLWGVYAFGGLYFVEMAMRILARGWGPYWRSFRSRLDCLTTLAIGACFLLSPVFGLPLKTDYVRFLEITRVLRLLHLLGGLRRFKIIVRTFLRLLPAMAPLMMLLFCFLCLYCAVGVQLFGGLVYKGNPDLESTSYVQNNFTSRNFNDFASGMVTIFDLLMASSWLTYQDAFVRATHNQWTSVYFISFYVLAIVYMLNLVVAFVLSAFVTQMKIEERREAKRLKALADGRLIQPQSPGESSGSSRRPPYTLHSSPSSLRLIENMFKAELETAKIEQGLYSYDGSVGSRGRGDGFLSDIGSGSEIEDTDRRGVTERRNRGSKRASALFLDEDDVA